MKRSVVNVREFDENGKLVYDSRVDRRRPAPLTAAGPPRYKPIIHPTRQTPTPEEQELKDDYIASGLDAFNKSGPPPPDRR